MPRTILDLPDEILDSCMEELLPPVSRHQTTLKNFPEPLDLCRLSTVCRTFHQLALPWVWKRVDIHDIGQDEQNPWRWTHLCEYPDLASHTRSLSVHIRSSINISHYLVAIRTVVSNMVNLQAMRVWGNGLRNETIGQLHATLVTQPRLHTLITMGYTHPTPFQRLPRLAGIKHLQMSAWSNHEVVLATTPCVEYLAIMFSLASEVQSNTLPELPCVRWTSLPIPWAMLREITIYDDFNVDQFYDWDFILDNFSAWRTSFPNTPFPLAELFVTHSNIEFRLKHVQTLRTIGTQLRALCLGYFEEINERTLTHLVDSFPRLHEVRLLGSFRKSWSVEPRTIVEALGKLSILKRLHWNYVSQDLMHSTGRHLAQGCRSLLPTMAEACQTLKMVVFHLDFPTLYHDPDQWTSFAILRNDDGGYESVLEAEGSVPWSRFTSGWDHGFV